MARDGSGTMTLLATFATAGQAPAASSHNAIMADIAQAITDSVNKDGTKAFAANQSMGNFRLTSLGSATARTDGANAGQVQDGKLNWVDGGGTADAITATYVPAITALVDGQLCFVRATAANATTTPTFAPNGLTARTIVKSGGVALAAGDIAGDGHELALRYDLANTRWELINPKTPVLQTAASTTETLTGTDTAKFVTADSLAALWEANATDITDGATITIGEGGYFNLITSTTAITAITVTTNKAGRTFRLRFDTARTLTHNATSLILPTGASIQTEQGAIAQFRSLGSGDVICEWYVRPNSDPRVPDVIVEEQQVSGTDGGTFTSGADQVRVLNTLVRNAGTLASLATNQVTLPIGNYYVKWDAPAFLVDVHQTFLYNVTGAAEIKRGMTVHAPTGSGSGFSVSSGSAYFSLAAASALELRHRASTTRATDGFGRAGSFGTEVYTRVEIWRLP